MAIDSGGWIYQGRQAHGWFGTGTKPKLDEGPPDRDPADDALFEPRNLGERIDYAARATIGFAGRRHRHEVAFNPDVTALARLRNAMTAWYGARALSREAFRRRFLDPSVSDETVDRLCAAARLTVEARSHAELGRAGAELAGAAQRVGVAKASGEGGDIVLSAAFSPVPSSTAGGPKPADQESGNHNLTPVTYFITNPDHAASITGSFCPYRGGGSRPLSMAPAVRAQGARAISGAAS